MRASKSSAQWSKDYIEHLRTVHFALIGFSIAVILMGRSLDGPKLRTADRQLHTIIDFFNNQISALVADQSVKSPRQTWLVSADPQNHKHMIAVALPYSMTTIDGSCKAGTPEQINLEDYKNKLAAQEGPSLKYFKDEVWNKLNCAKFSQYRIYDYGAKVYPLRAIQKNPPDFTRATMETQPVFGNIPNAAQTQENASTAGVTIAELILLDDSELAKREDELKSGFAFSVASEMTTEVKKNTKLVLYKFSIPGTSQIRVLPVLMEKSTTADGNDELARLESTWTCKSGQKQFSDCFRELNDAVNERTDGTTNKEDYTLKALSEWLDDQATHADPRHIDIFGVTFPAESQSQWGIVLILILLAYFWLSLSELSSRLGDHSGLSVPWPGLYPSPIAYGLIWLSIIVVPLWALLVLGLNRVHYYGRIRDFRPTDWAGTLGWIAVPVLLYTVLSILACVKLRRLALLAESTREQDEAEPEMPAPESASTAKAGAN